MSRWFNVAGPCKPELHYMLPPTARLPDVLRLIERQSYFVLHAPRQTGKTTAMLSLAQELTSSGRYTAALLSVEVGAPFSATPDAAERAILSAWRGAAAWQLPPELQPPPWPDAEPGARVSAALQAWSTGGSRPLVLFLDEIDALQDAALLSLLRQLREGYPGRPRAFPHALALVGLRDVRDYKVASGGSERLQTASPFNIKVESLTLRDFTAAEVMALYGQHTADTEQVFTPEALERACTLTQGQPWLVNALARQAVEVIVPDPAMTVDVTAIEAAKERLIERQDTHLDSLAERLREPRVRAIIEPMLAGQALGDIPPDDLRFVQELGLVRLDPEGGLVVANPIYQEVIPRVLAATTVASLPRIAPEWLTPEGHLNTEQLLASFLVFWREHAEALLGSVPYVEVAPHLVLMAFLHRVANGGGSVQREYAIGRDRMDLLLTYGSDRVALELKVWAPRRADPLKKGLQQLDSYLARLGLATGWLIIFDRRPGLLPLAERTTAERVLTPRGREVTVIRA